MVEEEIREGMRREKRKKMEEESVFMLLWKGNKGREDMRECVRRMSLEGLYIKGFKRGGK